MKVGSNLSNSYLNLPLSDSIAPVITFISPSSKTSGSPVFKWRSSEEAVFECSLDRGAYENCGRGTNGQWSEDNVPDGLHTLLVRGRDPIGNLGRAISHSWVVGRFLLTKSLQG